jgi:hypothetical protein
VGYYVSPKTFTQYGYKRDANGVIEFPIKTSDNNVDITATGINDTGEIVGYFGGHGFLLTGGAHGTITLIDVPGARYTSINGINNLGDFFGNFVTLTGTGHDFVSVGGVITRIDFPGATRPTRVTGLAWDGSVVGYYYPHPGALSIAFVRGPKGNFLRFQVPNSILTVPTGINNAAGQIVGSYRFSTGRFHGFVYDYVADLATLGSESTRAVRTVPVQTIDYPSSGPVDTYITGVNAQGIIVGNVLLPCPAGEGGPVPFIGTPEP